VKDCLQLC